ncbi:MAG: pilus assembly protein PilN [Candidatus Thioglobus sp. MED-G25]|jgi:type IV pilus assembly protein PilN|nr:PilN domain-containing protein [Gammaproteobacteria bacterium]PDH42738.1 MAG: pilus assembly protein PilN [Candidatus Thioglobus sp. MED-G25]|tara:strand:- start:187 stop:723 length:537 start_codon:yes stop_codon:yes gene_type:complete
MNQGINLLPWREARRRRQRRQLWTAIVVICIVAASVFATAWWTQSEEISFQTSRNAYLLREIRKVQTQLEEIDQIKQRKKALVARMTIIRQLQQEKVGIVRTLDNLVRALPEGLYFVSAKRSRGSFNLEGIAQSNARVSELMLNLNSSVSFGDSHLEVIRIGNIDETQTSRFELMVSD